MPPVVIEHRIPGASKAAANPAFSVELGAAGPVFSVTLACSGDMSVLDSRANRERYCGAIGVAPDKLVGLVQVHSRKVLAAEDITPISPGSRPPDGDGLVTNRKDLVLSVTAADCMPIAVFDRKTGAFGIVHSGWKGTGIVREAVSLMEARYGTLPEDLVAAAGPGIGSCCYSVPEERAIAFRHLWGADCAALRDDTWYLSLWNANLALMEGLGIRTVHRLADCTCCSDLLGSYRREGFSTYTHMLATIRYFQ